MRTSLKGWRGDTKASGGEAAAQTLRWIKFGHLLPPGQSPALVHVLGLFEAKLLDKVG
jgi:hypothetical protein